MQAVRRLGFSVRFNLRQVETKERAGAGGVCLPISAPTFSGWSFHPSECLPCQDGRGGKRQECKKTADSFADLPKEFQLSSQEMEMTQEEVYGKPMRYGTTAEAIEAMKTRLKLL